MRAGWSRRDPVVRLAADDIEALVRAAVPGARVSGAELLAGGLSNTNYRVTVDDCVLRLRVFHHGAAAAERECAVVAGLPPEVPTARLVHFAREGPDGRPVAVLEWVEGERLEVLLPRLSQEKGAALGRDVGRVLAAIHRRTFPVTGLLSPSLEVAEPFGLGAEGLIAFAADVLAGPGGARLGETLARDFLAWLRARAALLDVQDPPCLAHADFGGSNILVASDAPRVAAVLDWEHACSGGPLMDFGNLLRPPVGEVAPFAAGVVDGYRDAGGALPADWRPRALLADLFAWLDFLRRDAIGDAIVASARARIAYTMAEVGT